MGCEITLQGLTGRRVVAVIRAGKAGAMGQELSNRYALHPRVCRPAVRLEQLRERLSERRIECETALLDQLGDAGTGDGFRKAGEEHRAGGVGATDCALM